MTNNIVTHLKLRQDINRVIKTSSVADMCTKRAINPKVYGCTRQTTSSKSFFAKNFKLTLKANTIQKSGFHKVCLIFLKFYVL